MTNDDDGDRAESDGICDGGGDVTVLTQLMTEADDNEAAGD
jgi:hypothetical protein